MSTVLDRPAPYGVRAIRHLKKTSSSTRVTPRPCMKRQHAINKAYDYFLKEVDPIVGDCITFLLCVQPDNVPKVMLEYLSQRKKGEKPSFCIDKPGKTSKAQRLFLATQISPVLTKVVNRIATSRPENVLDFMCTEIEQIIKEQSISCEVCDDRGSEVDTPSRKAKSPSSALEIPSAGGNLPAHVDSTTGLPPATVPKGPPRNIQIIMLGAGGAGKTSFVNSLQGNFDPSIKATIGFRPTSMMMGDDTKVKFYDLGGSKKIRSIWPEYFHDVHGIVYIIDATLREGPEAEDSVKLFQETIRNPMLSGKPVLIVANKQDVNGAMTSVEIVSMYGTSGIPRLHIGEISCNPHKNVAMDGPEVENLEADPKQEESLEWLLKTVQENYDEINSKVTDDSKKKQEAEAAKRMQRERKVLRTKILCAFPDKVDKSFLTPDMPTEPEDVFTQEEGIKFLAAEIGEEVEALSPEALEVAAMIGYQRLALQMVGALKAPISKKKTPMSWTDIRKIVKELRQELGLQ
mmetsp:Transcript_9123/g.13736  ORF Transcript_9123/g.13736 Transcript_9123/m.13736 type:complete len:517 (+) Transcript_9123:96-1646(+)|eukprot:CAMPEP_0185018850 /NCGR_PEP_ID=MMETSP1103-20130426/1515_1 /TAXON_ID=36769 /ORGANISM="Paraphysomonas bandaiensis, Strain Caron Lab Isolate" /LENGTH=516 /DNA_ID=CAMNT_0027548859 /DNA_START=28 /DNA_END=1578 /DNA_ORIENTATION=+